MGSGHVQYAAPLLSPEHEVLVPANPARPSHAKIRLSPSARRTYIGA